jgi:hypothetical protein
MACSVVMEKPTIQAYQPKFSVFLEKNWVNAQTVVGSNPKKRKK